MKLRDLYKRAAFLLQCMASNNEGLDEVCEALGEDPHGIPALLASKAFTEAWNHYSYHANDPWVENCAYAEARLLAP